MIWLGLALGKLALLGGVSFAVLFALDILRTRRLRLTVASNLLWGRSAGERDARSLVAKWKRPVSFLLHAAIALLLLLALGDPRPKSEALENRTVVFVIDVSASMQATDVLPSRLAFAKERAHASVLSMGEHDQAMVVLAGSSVTPKSSMTSDKRVLHAAIDEARPTDAPADLRAAITYAAYVLRGTRKPVVRIFSDGQLPVAGGSNAPLDLGVVGLEYERIGKASNNVAITECSARRNPFDREHFEMLVEVTNTGTEPAHADLTVFGDGKVIDATALSLAARQTISRTIPDLSGASEKLEAVLTSSGGSVDYLAVDDHAFASLSPMKRARVLRVSSSNAFLDAALSLDSTLEVVSVTPEQYPGAIAAAHFDVVVFDGVSPVQPPSAHAFYIDPRGAGAPVGVGRALSEPGFDKVNRAHPVLRHIELAEVNIKSGHELVPLKGDTVIGSSGADEKPIMVAGVRGDFRFVALGFDLRESDLALRAAFPLFVAGTMRWLLATTSEFEPGLRTGEWWRLPVPGAPATALLSRDGAETKHLAVADGFVSLPGQYVGFHRLSGEGIDQGRFPPRAFAANLANVRESTIAAAMDFEIDGTKATPMAIGPPRTDARPWVVLVSLALLLALVEWALFHRRIAV